METSSFRVVFGNAPIVKVMDFFLDHREFDYSLSDIAENADIGWSTLHLFWGKFEKLGIVKHTRTIGRAKLYKLNESNALVKKLIGLDKQIAKVMVKQELKKQMVKVKR